MRNIRKMPIGIQDFEKLRKGNFVYVDKTEYVYRLASSGKPYFLGRPRRFGKSLFLSTLKAYFLGKKELFAGLKIAELEKDWAEYPVIYIDMNKTVYRTVKTLKTILDSILQPYETKYEVTFIAEELSVRLDNLIQTIHQKTGKKVVVLIDEYDKPLLGTMDNLKINDRIYDELKNFYGILKSADQYLHFVFLTGITKFLKYSIFSDLHYLSDISMDEDFAGICGISLAEIKTYFDQDINRIAIRTNSTYEQILGKLKNQYDGYCFVKQSETLYNTFSLLNTFDKHDFSQYWFSTGAPSFLAKMLQRTNFDIARMDCNIKISAASMLDYRAETGNLAPLMYQTGYMTIKSYDADFNEYTVGFPNNEVKYGFLNELLPLYISGKSIQNEFTTSAFVRDIRAENIDAFMNRIREFFSGIPGRLANAEKFYQNVFFILFKLMGQFLEIKQYNAADYVDTVIVTDNTVYVFEFKLFGKASAEDAMKHLEKKSYRIPYDAKGKRLVKVGAEFGAKERTLNRWIIKVKE